MNLDRKKTIALVSRPLSVFMAEATRPQRTNGATRPRLARAHLVYLLIGATRPWRITGATRPRLARAYYMYLLMGQRTRSEPMVQRARGPNMCICWLEPRVRHHRSWVATLRSACVLMQ